MNNSRPLALTGIKPTGDLHLGNYLGAIREGLKLCETYDCYFFIADFHSLTTQRDPKQLREQSYDIAAAWMACGLDTDKHLLYRQSDLPLVAEYSWYLSCFTGMGLLGKAHAYKDAIAKGKEANHGLFAYPVLMAGDIMLYDADVVPVGKDQKQHIEFARDMAGSINTVYGEGTVKAPEPLINEEVMLIPGLDGEKMSKSYNNVIPLFCSEKKLRKTIMGLKTDSSSLEEPKQLEGSLLEKLYVHFSTAEQQKELSEKLAAGGFGWGHAKEELFERINEDLKAPRQRYEELRAAPDEIDKVLRTGAERAFEKSLPILNRLRKALGFSESTMTLK